MTVAVKHQAPSQRKNYRVSVPINISLKGQVYRTIDWSVTGFKLAKFKEDSLEVGQSIGINVYIPFQGFNVGFRTQARIVRIDTEHNTLAGELTNLNEREKEVLKLFVDSIIKGEMEEVDGIIRRLDIPVTPISLTPEKAVTPAQQKEEAKRRYIGSIVYGALGLALTTLLLAVAYTNIFQMEVDTAILHAPTDKLISPATGDVAKIDVYENDPVKKGDSIITFIDTKLESDISLAALRVEEANINLERAEAALYIEEKRLAATQGIVSEEWEGARTRVRTLEQQLKIKQASIERSKKLYDEGLINQVRLDKAYDDFLETEQALNKAQQEANRLRAALSGAEKGFQVRNQRAENGLQDLEEELKAAQQLQLVAINELELLKEQRDRLIVRAPADGTVRKLMVSESSPVRYGASVAVFERSNIKETHAFVTRKQALSITIGEEAEVYFPSLDKTVMHRIKNIDSISQSLDNEQGIYTWQPESNKAITVRLEPLDASAEQQLETIIPGTPAVVIFDKNPFRQTFNAIF